VLGAGNADAAGQAGLASLTRVTAMDRALRRFELLGALRF